MKFSNYVISFILTVIFVFMAHAFITSAQAKPEMPLDNDAMIGLGVYSSHQSFGPVRPWINFVKAIAAVETRGHYRWVSKANTATGAKGVLQILQSNFDRAKAKYNLKGDIRELKNQAFMLEFLQLEANRMIMVIPGYESFDARTIFLLRASIHFGGNQQVKNLRFAYMLDSFFKGDSPLVIFGCCTKGWDYVLKVGAFLGYFKVGDVSGSKHMKSVARGAALRRDMLKRGWTLD